MKNDTCCSNRKVGVYAVTILGTFLIVAGLVALMIAKTRPAPLGQARAEERRKAFAEIHAANVDALNNYAVLNPVKNTIRLPIERAMALTIQEWQNPAAARSNLIARVEKATAPEPKAPEKPSEFE